MSKISTAHDIRVEDYLKYPELKIPMFQRDYVWDAEEIEEFWSDLVEEQVQFLGSLILKDQNYNSDTREGFLEIVDGQQRTVSLLILLSTISRKLLVLAGTRKEPYERNAEKQSDDISQMISKRDRNDLTKVLSYKLSLPNVESDLVLKQVLDGDVIKNPSPEYKNYYNVQKKFEQLVDSFLTVNPDVKGKIESLVNLKNRILDIKVIEIHVPTDDDAYVIFETVNARGAELGAAELLKNHLFARIRDSKDQAAIHEEWQKIKKTLNEIDRRALDLSGFLRYYWIGKYDHLSKKSLYSGIKKRLSSKSDIVRVEPKRIFEEIKEFRVCLERIFLDGLDDWQTYFGTDSRDERRANEWFSFKQNLDFFPKSIQYLPIYTALVGNLNRLEISHRSFIDLLMSIEKINFLYSHVLQKQTNRIDKLLSQIGRDVLTQILNGSSEKVDEEVQKGRSKIEAFLADNLDKDSVDKYIAKLSCKKVSDKSIINFILMNLEYELGGYSRLLVRADLSLEHVYPKSVEKKGKIKGWPKLDFDYSELGHGIGNLTLLPRSGPHANGSAGEECFKIKRDEYLLPSTYSLNRYFENIDNWSGSEIKNRVSVIQELVWKRWGPQK